MIHPHLAVLRPEGAVSYSIVLPLPPPANHYMRTGQRTTKAGKKYHRPVKTQQAKDYQATVAAYCLQYRLAAQISPLTGPIGCLMVVYLAELRGDLEGREKVLKDALQGGLYVDDKQIKESHEYFAPGRHKRARVEVCVWEMKSWK